uniref:Uncharacterized protein n=1 Tax=Oryza brachyantha TaxID=4533 RepID=J3M3U6_ORYBR
MVLISAPKPAPSVTNYQASATGSDHYAHKVNISSNMELCGKDTNDNDHFLKIGIGCSTGTEKRKVPVSSDLS